MGPGEVDVQVIRRHLAALRESLEVLAARSGVSLEELDADTELLWVVERGLQLCAQNALDIATHIVASRGRDVPFLTAFTRRFFPAALFLRERLCERQDGGIVL